MTLEQTLAALGMVPPRHIPLGKFVRFPGSGKGGSNKAGWCRLIMPTLAVYGDWSTGLSEVWHSDDHIDSAEAQRLLREALERDRRNARELAAKHAEVAHKAKSMLVACKVQSHAYLVRKGFPEDRGLVLERNLFVPLRDVGTGALISAQLIAEDGEKRFLTGGRTMNAVHLIGARPDNADRIVLCEGYATGLSLHSALSRLRGLATVVCCLSAYNMERVASRFPGAVVAADNDPSKVGEQAAIRTGLQWTMPPALAEGKKTDFNDLHAAKGIHAVVTLLREAFASSV